MKPRIVLITGDGLRHRFAASRLAETVNLVAMIAESKPALLNTSATLPATDAILLRDHFAERDRTEHRLMGGIPTATFECRSVRSGESNSPAILEWIRARKPDLVALYGCSIIDAPLLEFYDQRVVNLHLGLSPYYRGAATNFWPLVERRPECVGATIHLAVAEVDAGPVLAQSRPSIAGEDGPHEIGTNALISGLMTLGTTLVRYHAHRLVPTPLSPTTGHRLCRRKDFNADAVRRLREQFRTGMITEYLEHLAERQERYPIVTLPS